MRLFNSSVIHKMVLINASKIKNKMSFNNLDKVVKNNQLEINKKMKKI